MGRLTDSQIRTAKPGDKVQKLSDGQSLYLWIYPTGAKTFRYKYRFPRPNDMGELVRKEDSYRVGAYPAISLKQARKERDRVRALLEQGIDPKEDKRRKKREIERKALAPSFGSLTEDWLELSNDTDRHKEKVRRSFEKHAFPTLKAMRAEDIVYADIEGVIKGLTSEGKYDMAGRVLSRIRSVLDLAQARGLIVENIARNEFLRKSISKAKPKIKHFPALKFDQVPDLMQALEDYAMRHGVLLQTPLLIKLSLLTFVRPGEARYAALSEFNLKKKQWEIPGERMKEGRPHIVPLARQTLVLLQEIKALKFFGPWLLPGRKPYNVISENTVNKALRAMDFTDATHHGMRTLFSTEMHERGYLHDHIEIQLAHKVGNKVSASYNHAQYLSQRREMMQIWADLVKPDA